MLRKRECASGCSLPKSQQTGQAGGKESLLYFRCQQRGGPSGEQTSVQRPTLPTANKAEGESFYRRGVGVGGYMQKQAAISDSHLPLLISGLSSITLVVLGAVNLQFQGPFVLISLCPILGIVAALIMGTVW